MTNGKASRWKWCSIFILIFVVPLLSQQNLNINDQEYFETPGLNVMVFHDFYPEGHQGGVALIQHGVRTATNGDLRLSPTPGQWQPLPKMIERTVHPDRQEISVSLMYPDSSRHRRGFNPMIYPDLEFHYTVRVKAEDTSFKIIVDLEKPLPEEWVGRVGFNLELFPTIFFGKTFNMDGEVGLFPRQANGPMVKDANGDFYAAPLAKGEKLIIAPRDDKQQLNIESTNSDLLLLDGRGNHNNGWFVVRSLIPAGETNGAIEWNVTPHVIPNWQYEPVIHVSQVGFHPDQPKRAVIELDEDDMNIQTAMLKRLSDDGDVETVKTATPEEWGQFLRYKYVIFDFSDISQQGMYFIEYGDDKSNPFQISSDVYQRHVWQPTLEYFLPVQMCHMRVNEKYRVWHGMCHMDDALMAPTNINHFDGYSQGSSTLTHYNELEHVPGLNAGGWHDAGDYDLRVESQAGTVYMLALAYEEFNVEWDQTLIDQKRHVVEIHHPDGKPDVLQQVEHGVLSILGGYKNLGRLYRGIICPTLRQYVMLGDAASMTDNQVYRAQGDEEDFQGIWYTKVANEYSSTFDPLMQRDEIELVANNLDDRLVFTEQNPGRALDALNGLAAASRVLRDYNADLAEQCLHTAEALWTKYGTVDGAERQKIRALTELILTTEKESYKKDLVEKQPAIKKNISRVGWVLGRVLPHIDNPAFTKEVNVAITKLADDVKRKQQQNPFGVPYDPHIWGAGWGIQEFGVHQYFLHKGWPDTFPRDYMLNALNFILGTHPGQNTASFASGVGANSLTVAYGVNRADWSFIPGGSASGTALIRPDFPELKTWPFLWQQTEYVMGGGAANYMFLVLAAQDEFVE